MCELIVRGKIIWKYIYKVLRRSKVHRNYKPQSNQQIKHCLKFPARSVSQLLRKEVALFPRYSWEKFRSKESAKRKRVLLSKDTYRVMDLG